MIAAPTTAIILEPRKMRADGRYPVKLRVIFRRKYKDFACIYDPEDAKKDPIWKSGEVIAMTQEEFDSTFTIRPRDTFKAKQAYLNKLDAIAVEVIRKLGKGFSFQAFTKKYLNEHTEENNLFKGLETAAKEMRAAGRISTAVSVECTINSLQDFYGKKPLPFEEIDPAFLTRYEKWMTTSRTITNAKGKEKTKNPCSLTTIGIYLRNVRSAYNSAVRDGVFNSESYPFGRGRYQIPGGWNVKKALTHKDVGLIANYQAIEGSMRQQARDYWLFSFLCNGINVKDIARLTYGNIDGDTITLIRAKTARETKSTPRPIVIIITKQIGRIIDRWGVKPATSDQYIFPILKNGITPEQEHRAIQQMVQNINKNMKKIAKVIGITSNVTTYVARHSFATVLKRSGASTEFISESFAHSTLKTTANYLGSFENDVKREWAEKLANYDT